MVAIHLGSAPGGGHSQPCTWVTLMSEPIFKRKTVWPMAKKSGLPAIPKHLSKEAGALWDSVNHDYALESWQLKLLESACECHDRMRQAQADIARLGIVIEQPDGRIRGNPACQVERDARSNLYQHLRGLGLDIMPPTKGKGR